jgi:multidrug efflux pump subunit AcrB
MVVDPQDLGKIALKPGLNVYLRDVARIEDATDLTYGYALVNGRKSIYIPMVKKDTASTLDVVARIRAALPLFQSVLPENVTVRYEFDDSPTVVAAIRSVATEGLIGASLTGLMILLFLRDWRSVVVVVLNIPMALLGSLVGLWLAGQTLNIMTLGGLALAVGLLVDEATVSVENIHVQMVETPSLARAVERGSLQTAVPRLLAMLCILSVFIPAFLMQDPVRALFLPLALAVGFAMVTSYVLSSTVVPVLSVWLLRHRGLSPVSSERREVGDEKSRKRLFGHFQLAYATAVGWMVRWRRVVVLAYLGACVLVLWQVGSRLGNELFPQIDSGVFVLRFRPPPGSSYEVSREVGLKCLEVIGEEAGEGNVAISMGYVGQCPPNYAINNLILFMRGPDDGMLRVALRKGSGIGLDEFRERLRNALPERVVPWLTKLLQDVGLPPDQAAGRARMVTFGFAPGDMVSEVMSFGSPTPIEVAVISPHLPDARAHAERVLAEMKKVPYLRDVQLQQSLEYPTVQVEIDREKAGLSGVEVRKVGQSVTVATSSSRYVAVNFWQDRKTGVDYQVQVQVPVRRMTSPDTVEDLPLEMLDLERNLLVRDVASVKPGVMPGEYDRLFGQRFVSITANLEGEDFGRAAGQIEKAIRDAGEPPRGVRVQVRGQLPLLRELFQALGVGLAVAVFVILVLLTAYFESPRLALVTVSAVPGVVSGVAVMLCLTGTTLNLESFMGAIMCVGVSVSNSVMLVAFTAERWRVGLAAAEAAVAGAVSRLRPILMTATAMTIGTIPMALALEEGSAMTAPLGRAVIGGLIVSTFTTLLVLPAFFAVVIGRRSARSSSVHPDDPASAHYDAAQPVTG